MSKSRYSLSIVLVLCIVLQGSGLSFASANGVADCGMDMQQMAKMPMNMQQDSHDHSTMHHEQASPTSVSDVADCCDVDNITRSDCTDMPDCQSCGSMISLSIPNSAVAPATPVSTNKRWLHPPSTRTFSPPDLWRPPMTA
ncbi:MAG: hypothetical protein WBJ75_08860 [Pseudohongiellaceae bacterium]